MTERETDALIGELLLDAVAAEFQEELRADAVIPVSDGYRRRMKRLLERAAGRPARRRRFRAFAGAAAACLVLFGTALTASPAAGAALRSWWVRQTESGWFSYIFAGEQRTGGLPPYEIQALPEGYAAKEDGEFFFSLYRTAVYEDEAGREIVLTWGDMFQGAELRLYTEDMERSAVTVGGCRGTLLTPKSGEGAGYLVWMDDAAECQFILKAAVGREELLAMAESVAETPK